MNDKKILSRSPKLMSADDTALLVVDVQEKLVAVMDGREKIVFNVRQLVEGAKGRNFSGCRLPQPNNIPKAWAPPWKSWPTNWARSPPS